MWVMFFLSVVSLFSLSVGVGVSVFSLCEKTKQSEKQRRGQKQNKVKNKDQVKKD